MDLILINSLGDYCFLFDGYCFGFVNGMAVIKSRAASFIITWICSIYKVCALLLSGGASFMLFGRFETVGQGRIMNYIPIAIYSLSV